MIFIVIKNNNILNICDTLDNLYHNLLSYIRIILYCTKDKLDFFNDLQILEYNNNIPVNSYKIDTTNFYLYSINNKITINNPILENCRIELLEKLNNTESEINLFLPLNTNNINSSDMNIYIKSNNKTKEDEILLLKQKIELEKQKLEEHNNKYDKILTKFLEDKHQIGLIETKLKIKLEREEEKKRIFKSDLYIYNCLIQEIDMQTRDKDDIPDIFKNKFIIIQKLYEDENFISNDESEQYIKYVNTSNEMNLTNKFIKTKYDDMFENVSNNNSDISDTESENSNNNDNDSEYE